MPTRSLLIFFLFLLPYISFAQWEWQYPLAQGNHLYDVSVQGNHIWTVGHAGTILHSINGTDWEFQDCPEEYNYLGIKFVDPLNGWACGQIYDQGIILHTIDGGENWSIQAIDTVMGISDVCFIDELAGWVCGSSGAFYNTSDGGQTWKSRPVNTAGYLMYVSFLDTENGWMILVDEPNKLLKTTDGGNSWNEILQSDSCWYYNFHVHSEQKVWIIERYFNGTDISKVRYTEDGGVNWVTQLEDIYDQHPYDIYFTDELNGWIAYSTGLIKYTQDGGSTWDEQINTKKPGLSSIDINDQIGCIVGNKGKTVLTYDGGNTWEEYFDGNYFSLHTVFALSGSSAWAAGDSGTILRTNDGGSNWYDISSSFDGRMQDLYFLDENTGWVVGSSGTDQDGYVGRTYDGGLNWEEINVGYSEYLYSCFFRNQLNGWVAGNSGDVFLTLDGGDTWDSRSISSQIRINHIYFSSWAKGWTIGNSNFDGMIYKTRNEGFIWEEMCYMDDTAFYGTFFLDSNNAWIVGSDDIILRTRNGWETWEKGSSGISAGTNSSIWFLDTLTGYLIHNHDIYVTIDGGQNWEEQFSSAYLYDIAFADPMNAWAVGMHSAIIHTDNGGSVWQEEVFPEPPLFATRVYPNPTNSASSIEYSLQDASAVEISIYNMQGRVIHREYLQEAAGKHTYNIDVSKLKPGLFLYQISTPNAKSTGKLVVGR